MFPWQYTVYTWSEVTDILLHANIKKKKKDNLKQCGIRPFCVKCLCLCWVSRTEGAETPPFLQEISSLPPFPMCRMHMQGCQQREKGCHHSGCSKRSEHHLCLGSPCPPLPGGGGDDTEQTQDAVWSVCVPWRAPSLGHSPCCKGLLKNPSILCPEVRLCSYYVHWETNLPSIPEGNTLFF